VLTCGRCCAKAMLLLACTSFPCSGSLIKAAGAARAQLERLGRERDGYVAAALAALRAELAAAAVALTAQARAPMRSATGLCLPTSGHPHPRLALQNIMQTKARGSHTSQI